MSALDSWTGLPSLSIDIGVDRHRRVEDAGKKYSSACHFRIAETAKKTKPERSHAPLAKPNSTAEHRRRANPRPRWTRLGLDLPPLPLPPARRPETGGQDYGGGGDKRTRWSTSAYFA
jgi:hypothetical protein